jgi:hypothetical protein
VSSGSDLRSVSTHSVIKFPALRRFIAAVLIAEDPLPYYSTLDQFDGLPERSTTP